MDILQLSYTLRNAVSAGKKNKKSTNKDKVQDKKVKAKKWKIQILYLIRKILIYTYLLNILYLNYQIALSLKKKKKRKIERNVYLINSFKIST